MADSKQRLMMKMYEDWDAVSGEDRIKRIIAAIGTTDTVNDTLRCCVNSKHPFILLNS